jgi:hypothetical protein
MTTDEAADSTTASHATTAIPRTKIDETTATESATAATTENQGTAPAHPAPPTPTARNRATSLAACLHLTGGTETKTETETATHHAVTATEPLPAGVTAPVLEAPKTSTATSRVQALAPNATTRVTVTANLLSTETMSETTGTTGTTDGIEKWIDICLVDMILNLMIGTATAIEIETVTVTEIDIIETVMVGGAEIELLVGVGVVDRDADFLLGEVVLCYE